jgi:type VI secretion system secreted protein VgrG
MFDYPGNYTERAAGEAYARTRLDARHTGYQRVQAATRARGLFPGSLFKLTEHPRSDQNRDYLIVGAQYALSSDTYEPTRPAEPEPVLTCAFTAISKQTEYRPPGVAHKPVVQGPQTAIVVGKAGEEIWTDKYGRIKVQFHWDRVGGEDEMSSCWVRVAQGWAGKRWGAMFLPRIGQEVIVSFLEGDPDRPLVTGSVYNADNMPPYPLPAQATRSTIKSNSSIGGGGYNELRFEDKKGSEQFYVHAERDLEQRVRRDALAWMGRDRHAMVVKDSFEQVGGDLHLKVGGDRNEEAGGSATQSAAMNMVVKGGMKSAVYAGQTVHIKAGMNVVIEAGANITLKAGAAFLSIGPAVIVGSTIPLPLPQASTAVNAAVLAATVPPTVPPTAPQEADDGKK